MENTLEKEIGPCPLRGNTNYCLTNPMDTICSGKSGNYKECALYQRHMAKIQQRNEFRASYSSLFNK